MKRALSPQHSTRQRDDGFAAVDAMVALTILTATITLAIGAVGTAHQASLRASETRRAMALLRGLLAVAPRKIGDVAGRSAGFDWAVQTRADTDGSAGAGFRICERLAAVRALESGRRYDLATAEACPLQDAAH